MSFTLEVLPTKPPGHGAATSPEPEATLETGVFGRLGGTIADPADAGSQKLQVYSKGVVKIRKTLFSLTKLMGGRVVVAAWDTRGVVFANTEGEAIAEFAWPPEGTGYVGIGRSLTRFSKERSSRQLSLMS